MLKSNCLLTLLVGMLATAGTNAAGQVTAGDLTITHSNYLFKASVVKDSTFLGAGRLRVFDGRGKQPVRLVPEKVQMLDDQLQIRYATNQPLSVRLELVPQGRCILWRVTCGNLGKEQLWLELGPEIQVQPSGKMTVFDGWDDVVDPSGPLPPPQQRFPAGRVLFPVMSAWTDNASVGVGLGAGELVSWFRHAYENDGPGRGRISCVARIVLDKGQSQTLEFVTIGAPGEWGKYEILEAYYETFPSYFVPYPGVDKRVSLGDSMQTAWPLPLNPAEKGGIQEYARRSYSGWSWCYAPFRRTGDIVCRPELWNYAFYRPPQRQYALEQEKFLEWRQKSFEIVKKSGLADLFYVDAVWCEKALAQEKYPDSLITGPDSGVLLGATAGCDVEVNVFPLNTSFGRQYEADTRQIVEELDPAGFALDCAGNTWRYTGPAVPTLPARAWDDKVGVYCGVETGVAKYMDFVHSLRRKDGSPVAVYPNPETGGPFAVFFRGDAAMYEGTPWNVERTNADRLRWKLGHKTMVWHAHWRLEELLDVATLKSAWQVKKIVSGLADFTLLQSLRLGAIPNAWMVYGNKKLMEWQPAVVECALTGWQPVPAAKAPEPLWTARYGRGLKTLIVAAHETDQNHAGTVQVQNKRISTGLLLMSRYDGMAVDNLIKDGLTNFDVKVPVRTPVLVRAEIEADADADVTHARVAREYGISTQVLRATIDGTGRTPLKVRVPEKMVVERILWNGRQTDFQTDPEWATMVVNNSGRGELEVRFSSKLFALDDEALLDFSFTQDNKPACTIVLPPSACEMEHLMAFRLQEYFKYWHGHVLEPATEVVIPVTQKALPQRGPVVAVRIDRNLDHSRITRDGDRLIIEAPTDRQLEDAMLEMLHALDRKYWTHGKVPGFTIFTKFGIKSIN